MNYLHDGHLAMTTREPWKPADAITSANVVWPEVKPGEVIRCGTCGYEFRGYELRPPTLAPESDVT